MLHEERIGRNSENQGWSTPALKEIPYVEHEWTVADIIAATTTVHITSEHEIDENGVAIIPMPLPTWSEIDGWRGRSRDKKYTHDARWHFAKIANKMEDLLKRAAKNTVVLLNADEVEPEPIDWLWKRYLARRKLHIFAGAPETERQHWPSVMPQQYRPAKDGRTDHAHLSATS